MSTATARRPQSGNLVDVLDRILDKGAVIDIWARVSLVGIEILTVEARVVIASVDTFLHYAEEISKIEQAEEEGSFEDLEIQSRDERTAESAGEQESELESEGESGSEIEIQSESEQS